MSGEQLVVLALLVAAFASGWVARGDGPLIRRRRDRPPADPHPDDPRTSDGGADHPDSGTFGPPAAVAAPAPAPTDPITAPMPVAAPLPAAGRPVDRPDPVGTALKALDRAAAALEQAVDRWVDERDAISPAGKAAVGEVDRAIKRLDLAASHVASTHGDRSEPYFAALDALDALRAAAGVLGGYREGRPLDASASRELDRVERELADARDALARG